jgi:saccharopine dehydrogenase-like NADP-dependent oxidoreductase
MTSERAVRVNGSPVRPLDVLRAVLLQGHPEEPGKPWAFFLHVVVLGRRNGDRVSIVQRAHHPMACGPPRLAG